MAQKAKEAKLIDIAAKQATSLLRYINIVPADKVWHQSIKISYQRGTRE